MGNVTSRGHIVNPPQLYASKMRYCRQCWLLVYYTDIEQLVLIIMYKLAIKYAVAYPKAYKPPPPPTHTQKPAFVTPSSNDELSELLQACNDGPSLDMFSGEGSMNLSAALVSKGSTLV